MALVGAAVGVEHDHAMIEVSVGDVDLVGLGVDFGVGRLAQAGHVIAVGLIALLADLQHEFAVARELQILPVLLAVAADPDEALGIDAHAMLVLWPVVALARAAPGPHQLALRVELHDRRSRYAAFAGRRTERRGLLVVGEASGALDHPDMVLCIDRDAGRLTHDPVVGQGLRPGRIDLKTGSIVGKRRRCGEDDG